MAGTFSQVYIQLVFAVKRRENLIQVEWEERLYQYNAGIIRSKEQKVIAINGMPDHLHLFIGMKPSCCLSDLVHEIKKSSNDFINQNHLSRFKFSWQEGYSAFSYSHLQVDTVYKYIKNQKEHHRKTSFKEEYTDLLNTFMIDYKDEYLFDWIE